MNIGYLGTDFQKATLNSRELVNFDPERLTRFLSEFPSQSPISEIVVLSTCNRVELYFATESTAMAFPWLVDYLKEFHRLDLSPEMSQLTGEAAINHLFGVASGIESMVFGEVEILGQVKAAYQMATKFNTTGSYLNKLFQMAITVGKRVRGETDISRGAYSMSSIAIDALKNQMNGQFREQRVLIVGAGTMAMRCIKKLAALKLSSNVTITNRTEELAQRIAGKYELQLLPYSEFRPALSQFDVVISATSSDQPIIEDDHLPNEQSKKLWMVDLGVPRNVRVDTTKLNYLELITVDDLNETATKTIASRKTELGKIKEIISEEISNFYDWYEKKQELCLGMSA